VISLVPSPSNQPDVAGRCNCFFFSSITTLQDINLVSNVSLRLAGGDVEAISALANLQNLRFGDELLKGSVSSLRTNVAVLVAIGRRLPDLELSGLV